MHNDEALDASDTLSDKNYNCNHESSNNNAFNDANHNKKGLNSHLNASAPSSVHSAQECTDNDVGFDAYNINHMHAIDTDCDNNADKLSDNPNNKNMNEKNNHPQMIYAN